MLGVIVGTGTGAGIVVRGHVVTGPNAIAGEWGHNPLPWATDEERPGRDCYCGRSGCIETFLSGPGLEVDYELHSVRHRSSRAIVAAAAVGEEAAEAALQRYEDRLARSLASVINVLDPEVIVLGGGMSNIDRLYDNVPKLWGQYVLACGASLHGSPRGPQGPAPHEETGPHAARARAARRRERRPRRRVAVA